MTPKNIRNSLSQTTWLHTKTGPWSLAQDEISDRIWPVDVLHQALLWNGLSVLGSLVVKPVANEHNSDSPSNDFPILFHQRICTQGVHGLSDRRVETWSHLLVYHHMAKAFSPVKQLQHLWLCNATTKSGCSEALEGFAGGTGAAELNAGGSYMPVWWWRCLVIKMNVAGTPVIGVPNHTRSFIRSSGVARRYPGIRHTPISDILAVTTTGRYRDVCVEAVWSRGHLGWIRCWRPDWRSCPLPETLAWD